VSRDRTSRQFLNAEFAQGRHVQRADVDDAVVTNDAPCQRPAFDPLELIKNAPQTLKPVTSKTRCVGKH